MWQRGICGIGGISGRPIDVIGGIIICNPDCCSAYTASLVMACHVNSVLTILRNIIMSLIY